MVAIKDIEMPKNCRECDIKGLRRNCDLIYGDNADICRHPNCPLIEIKERKVGKWIKEYDNSALDGLYHCSVCSRKLWIPKEESVSDYPYCHCGAEIRGSENG